MSQTKSRNLEDLVFGHLNRLQKHQKNLREHPRADRSIHKMRVSTRRLREALLFLREAIEVERADKLIVKMRKLTRVLGAIRSLDASAHLLRSDFSRGTHKRAAAFVAGRLLAERRKKIKKMDRSLKKFKTGEYRRDLRRIFADAGRDFNRRWIKAARRILEKRRERLSRGFAGLPQNSAGLRRTSGPALSAEKRMHELRIGMKKLRYDLEILGEVGDKSWWGGLAPLRENQRLLGVWHDHETLTAHIEETLRGLDKKERRAREAEVRRLLQKVRSKETAAHAAAFGRIKKNYRMFLRLSN